MLGSMSDSDADDDEDHEDADLDNDNDTSPGYIMGGETGQRERGRERERETRNFRVGEVGMCHGQPRLGAPSRGSAVGGSYHSSRHASVRTVLAI